jgi:hypothetical protein
VTIYAKQYEDGRFQTVYGSPILSASNLSAAYTAGLDSAADLKQSLNAIGILNLDAAVVMNRVLPERFRPLTPCRL